MTQELSQFSALWSLSPHGAGSHNLHLDCWLWPHHASRCAPLQDCAGHAPRYSEAARASLRAALIAARHVLAETCWPMLDLRTGSDLLPGMLRGSSPAGCSGRHSAHDLTGFHTALLWAGSSVVAVGEDSCCAPCFGSAMDALKRVWQKLMDLLHAGLGWLCVVLRQSQLSACRTSFLSHSGALGWRRNP